jgi:haloacetate dehalogenase
LDLAHDKEDWGKTLDMLTTWRERAEDVRGRAIDCGHFLAEEALGETSAEILAFLSGR